MLTLYSYRPQMFTRRPHVQTPTVEGPVYGLPVDVLGREDEFVLTAAVPGVFQPTHINGRDYVDGGLVSPVPVRTARELGAGFVIAVDISARPRDGRTRSSIEVLLQTFAIMGQALGRHETAAADVVIRPHTSELAAADFNSRHKAVLEGEKATAAVMAELKAKLERRRTTPR